MKIERLLNVLREALPWIRFASGDPTALEFVHWERRPSLAEQMSELLDAISDEERKWQSRPASRKGGWIVE